MCVGVTFHSKSSISQVGKFRDYVAETTDVCRACLGREQQPNPDSQSDYLLSKNVSTQQQSLLTTVGKPEMIHSIFFGLKSQRILLFSA